MKAAVLKAFYPAVGGFVTVYAETDDSADAICKRWQATREELAEAGCRGPTLEAIELVLTDPDLSAPGYAIFARDAAVVGTIALPAAPPLPVAYVGPLPHLRHALTTAPLLKPISELRELAIIAGIEASGRTAALTAVSSPEARTQATTDRTKLLAALRTQKRPTGKVRESAAQSGTQDAAQDAAQGVAQHAAQSVAQDAAQHAAQSVAQDAAQTVAWGVAQTMAALRAGLVAAVFLGSDPALAEPAWIGREGTELAVTRAELAESGLLAPLRDRTDEAIIRAAASNDADLFVLAEAAAQAPKLPEGVAATLRHPLPMS